MPSFLPSSPVVALISNTISPHAAVLITLFAIIAALAIVLVTAVRIFATARPLFSLTALEERAKSCITLQKENLSSTPTAGGGGGSSRSSSSTTSQKYSATQAYLALTTSAYNSPQRLITANNNTGGGVGIGEKPILQPYSSSSYRREVFLRYLEQHTTGASAITSTGGGSGGGGNVSPRRGGNNNSGGGLMVPPSLLPRPRHDQTASSLSETTNSRSSRYDTSPVKRRTTTAGASSSSATTASTTTTTVGGTNRSVLMLMPPPRPSSSPNNNSHSGSGNLPSLPLPLHDGKLPLPPVLKTAVVAGFGFGLVCCYVTVSGLIAAHLHRAGVGPKEGGLNRSNQTAAADHSLVRVIVSFMADHLVGSIVGINGAHRQDNNVNTAATTIDALLEDTLLSPMWRLPLIAGTLVVALLLILTTNAGTSPLRSKKKDGKDASLLPPPKLTADGTSLSSSADGSSLITTLSYTVRAAYVGTAMLLGSFYRASLLLQLLGTRSNGTISWRHDGASMNAPNVAAEADHNTSAGGAMPSDMSTSSLPHSQWFGGLRFFSPNPCLSLLLSSPPRSLPPTEVILLAQLADLCLLLLPLLAPLLWLAYCVFCRERQLRSRCASLLLSAATSSSSVSPPAPTLTLRQFCWSCLVGGGTISANDGVSSHNTLMVSLLVLLKSSLLWALVAVVLGRLTTRTATTTTTRSSDTDHHEAHQHWAATTSLAVLTFVACGGVGQLCRTVRMSYGSGTTLQIQQRNSRRQKRRGGCTSGAVIMMLLVAAAVLVAFIMALPSIGSEKNTSPRHPYENIYAQEEGTFAGGHPRRRSSTPTARDVRYSASTTTTQQPIDLDHLQHSRQQPTDGEIITPTTKPPATPSRSHVGALIATLRAFLDDVMAGVGVVDTSTPNGMAATTLSPPHNDESRSHHYVPTTSVGSGNAYDDRYHHHQPHHNQHHNLQQQHRPSLDPSDVAFARQELAEVLAKMGGGGGMEGGVGGSQQPNHQQRRQQQQQQHPRRVSSAGRGQGGGGGSSTRWFPWR